MSRQRVLFVCNQPPWLLNGGALIRNYWMLTALARRHAVDLYYASPHLGEPPADFRAMCGEIRNFPPTAGSRRRVLEALRPGESLFTGGRVPAALRAAAREALALRRYDAVHLGHLTMQAALRGGPAVPFVYDAHNCEAELLRRRAAGERPPLRYVLGFDARRLRAIERDVVSRAAAVTSCSASDVEDLAAIEPAVRRKVRIVPNGVDVAGYAAVRAAQPESRTVMISGSMDWRPNQLGLEWFLRDVLPELRRLTRDQPIHIRVAGRMDAYVVALLARHPEIVAVPNPPDMRAELAKARLVLAPITASSGTRLRILEAWAAGRPVVTTPAGALGIDVADGVDLLCRPSGETFARGIIEAIADSTLWSALRKRGLERAAAYDWHAIGELLLDTYSGILTRGR